MVQKSEQEGRRLSGQEQEKTHATGLTFRGERWAAAYRKWLLIAVCLVGFS